jgi:hypothetical protein
MLKEKPTNKAPNIWLKGAFGPAIKCPLVKVSLTFEGQTRTRGKAPEIMCAIMADMQEDMLLPPDILKSLGGNPEISESTYDKERGGRMFRINTIKIVREEVSQKKMGGLSPGGHRKTQGVDRTKTANPGIGRFGMKSPKETYGMSRDKCKVSRARKKI